MARRSFRLWVARFIPEEYGGAFYAIASGLALLIVIVFWQQSAQTIMTVYDGWRWLFSVISLLALAGFVWGVRTLSGADPLGLQPIVARLQGKKPRQMPFMVRGPYRWVRHPLYLCAIILIWSSPTLTTDRLLFDILWTIWIVIGTFLEERDLSAEFGDTYRAYQRQVPMLIPGWTWSQKKPSLTQQ